MRIVKEVYREITAAFSRAPIESGGILGRKQNVICKFFFDGGTKTTEYRIRTEILNPIIADWARNGVLFAGIIHSHPNGIASLSETDKAYAERILRSFPCLQYLIFPVVTVFDGHTKIFWHRYDGQWFPEKLTKE